jgi:AcrR family transcriptional regulator
MASTVRERVRAETINEIKLIARRHLASDGSNLSLRAVARDLGVVSSAVYRYFASRDELLTALIIDAYNDLGEHVERAEAAIPRPNLSGRWVALASAIRDWARANQPEYALVYGSPIPGYQAPQDTIAPASRPVLLLISILRDGTAGGMVVSTARERLPKAVRADLKRLAADPDFGGIPEPVFARAIGAWAQLFGLISFELFGRLVGAIDDYDAYFDYQVGQLAHQLGLHGK